MRYGIVRYSIKSRKVQTGFRALFIADLHGAVLGRNNAGLIRICRDVKPDVILAGGDMLTCRRYESYGTAARFLKKLRETAPVYAVNGNHETCAKSRDRKTERLFKRYRDCLEKAGVRCLNNESVLTSVNGDPVTVTGFEAPLSDYRKFRVPHLDAERLPSAPEGREETFSILLAHDPAFAKDYFRYGADLTLCGHYHGGVMRLKGHRILASPYGFPFPKYGYGLFENGENRLIVTSGLGDHAIPCRIRNPYEIVIIDVRPF